MIFDVICFGALNIDRLYKVSRIARAGEEVEIADFKQSPGGSAANTAVGLARLGLKTGYIGKTTKDQEGVYLLNEFKKEGVDISGIVISESGRCGAVIGFVDEKGERALYLDPGVNDTLVFEEINLEYAKSTKFLHLSSFAGEKPFQAQIRLVESLESVKVTLDPGMIYARKGLEKLRPLIKNCFAVFPNEQELRLITGQNVREGARVLLDEGVKIVGVKIGSKGCYVTNGDEDHFIKPFKVQVVDTTGAGDAFCAGFLYGLVKKKTLKECGLLGNFVASRVLTKMGAREGLPRENSLPISI
ncbi:MAG: carbohydrate kinase family protein [Nitrososphaerota archaeon]|nr:carbohydrate kinase family protein [Nitrososphaerota archaeon]